MPRVGLDRAEIWVPPDAPMIGRSALPAVSPGRVARPLAACCIRLGFVKISGPLLTNCGPRLVAFTLWPLRRGCRFRRCESYARHMTTTVEPRPHVTGLSLDWADPTELGAFYQQLLGGQVPWASDERVGVRALDVALVGQRVILHVPPVWPGTSIVHPISRRPQISTRR